MVPVPVIEHFLIDMEDGRYDGFPEDGLIIQPLENASLKRMYGLKEEQSGALVSSVTPVHRRRIRFSPATCSCL